MRHDVATEQGRGASIGCAVVLSALTVLSASPASAQQAPDTGAILRDIQKTTPQAPQAKPERLTPLPQQAEERPILGDGETVRVTVFHVTATQFPEAALQAVLAPWVGKTATLADLREAVARVGRYYRDHGYVARAYLPPQAMQDGAITIAVLEGRAGKVVIDPSSRARLDPDLAKRIAMARQPAAAPVRFDAVENGLATLAEQPGVQASGTLEAGTSEGLTDLRLRLAEGPRFTGIGLVDNEAPRSLGTVRGVAVLTGNDLTGRADQETLTLMKSAGSDFARLDATILALPTGLRVGVNGSGLDYKVARSFNVTTPDGWAFTGGLTAAQTLWRSANATFEGRVTYDHRYLVNRDAGLTTAISAIDVGSVGANGSIYDHLLGGGMTHAALIVTAGNLDLGGNAANAVLDRATAHTAGSYAKLNLSLSRTQPVAPRLEVVLRVSGQAANKNLDSSEQMSLGGADGVRAFALDEALGSSGVLGTVELAWQAQPSLRLAAFWDGGLIQRYAKTWSGWQAGGAPNTYGLDGPGVSARWVVTQRLILDGAAAVMVGGNPGRINGYDADGEHNDARVWLRATTAF
jgi:hemolysin activation/secretion protein